MYRVVSAAFAFITLAAAAAPALAQWRHGDDWRWHAGPPYHHYLPRREVIMVYPPPPPVYYAPGPRVVYVEPPPLQAVPTSPAYTDPMGRYCREYQTTVDVGASGQPGYGTACLMPDGQWRIVR